MQKNIWLDIREKVFLLFAVPRFRLLFITAGFMLCLALRLAAGQFNFLLGYLYLTFISLAGFWFGIKGGITAATCAIVIFLAEVNLYRYWPFRDLVLQTFYLRMLFYYLGGVSMGYMSGVERKLKEQLKALAYFDELTGCVNFRWTMHLLQNEIARAQRYDKQMAIVMIDLDFFKKINDKYGHLVGNEVLSEFAAIIRDNVRYVDIVGRYGGEEFLVILPEATLDQSLAVLQRVKISLEKIKITSLQLDIRFSAGIASYPYNGQNVHELLAVVDNALYEAKRTGRNRIIVERRRWLRVKPVKDLRFEVSGVDVARGRATIKVKNLSKRGLLLLTSLDIPAHDFVGYIYFPKEKNPLEVNCEVMHKTNLGKGLYSIGIFFLDISSEQQDKLLHSFSLYPEQIEM